MSQTRPSYPTSTTHPTIFPRHRGHVFRTFSYLYQAYSPWLGLASLPYLAEGEVPVSRQLNPVQAGLPTQLVRYIHTPSNGGILAFNSRRIADGTLYRAIHTVLVYRYGWPAGRLQNRDLYFILFPCILSFYAKAF